MITRRKKELAVKVEESTQESTDAEVSSQTEPMELGSQPQIQEQHCSIAIGETPTNEQNLDTDDSSLPSTCKPIVSDTILTVDPKEEINMDCVVGNLDSLNQHQEKSPSPSIKTDEDKRNCAEQEQGPSQPTAPEQCLFPDHDDCVIVYSQDRSDGPKLFHYIQKDGATILGPSDAKKAKLVMKIAFIPSIPYWGTEFWLKRSINYTASAKFICIKGGSLSIEVTNECGPAVKIDIYVLHDRLPLEELEVLSNSTVGIKWKPETSRVAVKFCMENRIRDFCLKQKESFKLNLSHNEYQFKVDEFKSRKSIPCFLVLVRETVRSSKVVVAMQNEINYQCESGNRATASQQISKRVIHSATDSSGTEFQLCKKIKTEPGTENEDIIVWSD